MKIFKKLFLFVCSLLILGVLSSKMVQAEDGIGFEVRPILPGTQIDKNLGYYYIQTEPGVKQSIDLSVYNTSKKEPITVEVFIENAISTSNGNIGYTDKLDLVDKSLKDPLSDIVKPETKEITVPPNEESIVKFDITPPESSYEGIKMGRVVIKEKDDDEEKGINQKYQYAVGIITAESGDLFNDGTKLELESAKAIVSNGSKVVVGKIINPEPKTIENLKVESYVTKKGSNKKLKERAVDNFSFAPNSMVDYQIPWGLTNFETGEYTFHFNASNEFETFKFTKDFKIRANDANKLNNQAAFSVGTPVFLIITIICLNVVLILIFIIIILRNKKWIKELKEKKKGNKGKKKGNKGKKKRH